MLYKFGICIAILALAILVYAFVTYYTLTSHMNKSNGDYDDHAAAIVATLDDLPIKTKQSVFMSGYIESRGDNIPETRKISVANKYDSLLRNHNNINSVMLHKMQDFANDQNVLMLDVLINQRAPTMIANSVNTTPRAKPVVLSNDRQNVHDSCVKRGLCKVLNRYIDLHQMQAESPIPDLLSELKSRIKDDKITNCINTMMANKTEMSGYDNSEHDILGYVYSHCKDEPNAYSALVTALRDCYENDNLVCSSGRAARVINSQVVISADPILAAGMMTFEAHRAEVLNNINSILTTTPHISNTDLASQASALLEAKRDTMTPSDLAKLSVELKAYTTA